MLDVPVPQLAEQLVEVPTIVSFSSLQRIMEQTVDIPVPSGGGRHADLQGFLRGQSSTGVEQIVDSPGGGLQGFRPGQISSASFSSPSGVHEIADEPGEGFFAVFPDQKKVRRSPSSRAHPRWALIKWLVPPGPRTSLTTGTSFAKMKRSKFWVRLDTGQWKLLRTDIVVDQPWP